MPTPRISLLRPYATAVLRPGATGARAPLHAARSLHATTTLRADNSNDKSQNPGGVPDDLGHSSFKGRTGGDEPLDSSSNAPPQPKISNLSVPGTDAAKDMSKEQKREVDQHNREFEKKHDHGQDAPNDKVDKKYWTGETQGKP